jgi:hypothetical protein
MNWEWLGASVDIIILVGGLFLAIERIFKPLLKLRQRGEENFEEKVVEILNRKLPDILLAHDLETREKYKQDRYNYLCQIKDEVLKCIQSELEQVDQLNLQYEALAISAKDVLREKIMAIYHKNKHERRMSGYEREALTQYYKDYKAINGNSYIDKYYARMKNWATDEDDYLDEDEQH